MIDNIPTVRLLGVKDPTTLDKYFSCGMVDIAYVHRIDKDRVDLLLDGIDVRGGDERRWVVGIITNALRECGEGQAEIKFLLDLSS